ncbi:RagB/SusD family nutrient uptake outer membrane protein [Flammeovirga sp. EKP202]|uniref:RagB/SusD family nutrient uptake outer membrane protein n=1 Tax=Flammeovirga sp. EKP202 TaxID=2770592 RepID=UPI00165EDEB3|nr:RagB/SusD family nutrient uptake outer membrane protein [Flammeovirga sp. EKP202]MBD0404930.1 RagB/SusD family nutrient uptake outer membrane protein [Flammeovirga sp. EKP202]
MKKITLFIASFMIFLSACNLSEPILDEALNPDLPNSDGGPEALMAATYNMMLNTFTDHENVWPLQQVSTDETICPTRGTDWDGNGQWREIYGHTWTAFHVTIGSTWEKLNTGLARAIMTESEVMKSDKPPHKQILAEAKAMKAFYMMTILDLWGKVPYREAEGLDFRDQPIILEADEAFEKIVEVFEDALSDLPSSSDVEYYQITKEAVNGMLARLYLNKSVYVNRYENVSFDAQDLDKVIAYTSELINNGGFALESEDYFSLFSKDNDDKNEIIFGVKQEYLNELGSNKLALFVTGRNVWVSNAHRGWNGGATTEVFYNTWKGKEADPRFHKENFKYETGSIPEEEYHLNRGFMVGQQYGVIRNEDNSDFLRDEKGWLIIDELTNFRNNEPMIFTPEVNLSNETQAAGVRVYKFEFDNGASNTAVSSVNIPIMRLAEIYLMRAEAKLRKGDQGGAVADINTVLSARGAKLLSSIDLEGMFNERGFELYWEGFRRTDRLRFGKFDETYKDKLVSDVNRRVYPIPQNALDANKDLIQNPGY